MSKDLPYGISFVITKSPHPDISHIPDLVADRGPAEYFHGRSQIQFDFEDLLKRARKGKSGTTFLIQGAPDAGKTALLDQCGKLARRIGWKIAMLRPTALVDPEELLDRLGQRGGDSLPFMQVKSGKTSDFFKNFFSSSFIETIFGVRWPKIPFSRGLISPKFLLIASYYDKGHEIRPETLNIDPF